MLNLLLEENWSESRVESSDTLGLQNLGEAADQATGKAWLGHKTNTRSLERAERNVGEELTSSSRGEIDGSAVVGRGFVTDQVDALLLEEFVSSELEGTLEEVSSESWTNTGPNSCSTLLGNDLSEATDEAAVVLGRIKLYSGLDAALRQLALTLRNHMKVIELLTRRLGSLSRG
jgi:hypothetical protein